MAGDSSTSSSQQQLLGGLKEMGPIMISNSWPEGFICLDCGLPMSEPSPYIEPVTGLPFSSDAKFIQTGKTGKIQANLESEYLKQYIRLRYFPDGIRNCYTLSVDKNRRYLIRARFIYGNYDDLKSNPIFDLHLGPNPWATIDLQESVNGTVQEIIHTPTTNSLQICLVKTGATTPLISALEWQIIYIPHSQVP